MAKKVWHVALITFRPNAPQAEKEKIYSLHQTLDEDCGGKSAGILFWKVDHNLNLCEGAQLVEISIFDSDDALQAFRRHPKHVELTDILSKVADWQVGDIHHPAVLNKMMKNSCTECGGLMIKTSFYDSDGEIAFHGIVSIDGEDWVCATCNQKL